MVQEARRSGSGEHMCCDRYLSHFGSAEDGVGDRVSLMSDSVILESHQPLIAGNKYNGQKR